ncbi:MAG: hypothetical protein AAF828_08225 [Bacteroidota bacterium]
MNQQLISILPILAICALLLGSCNNNNAANNANAEPPTEEETDGYLRLSSGPLAIAVDPKIGGRIASFTYEGTEILKTSRDSNDLQWGSTVWTSPQADWGWPPNPTFDKMPYTEAAKEETRVILVSDVDRQTGLQMTKSIRLAEDQKWGHVATIRYRIYNRGTENRKVAVWENTRVPFGGYLTYPSGPAEQLQDASKIVTIADASETLRQITFNEAQPDEQKIFYDPAPPTEGRYLEHSYYHKGLKFTKSWKRPNTVAPAHARLEVYLAPQSGFAELELQGEYVDVPPSGKAELTVFWQLEKVSEQ